MSAVVEKAPWSIGHLGGHGWILGHKVSDLFLEFINKSKYCYFNIQK